MAIPALYPISDVLASSNKNSIFVLNYADQIIVGAENLSELRQKLYQPYVIARFQRFNIKIHEAKIVWLIDANTKCFLEYVNKALDGSTLIIIKKENGSIICFGPAHIIESLIAKNKTSL